MSAVILLLAAASATAVLLAPGSRPAKGEPRGREPGTGQATTPSPPSTSAAPAPTVPPTTTPGPPYQVQDQTITLVDPSRGTPARGSVPAAPRRTLTTVIRRPVGESGPMPFVVFAHGWNSDPGVYASLLDTWASAGYLVAAPTFPDSADTLPGTPVEDFPDESRDLSFVITCLLDGRVGPVDQGRIAVAGHSDGGSDVDVLALDPSYADHRIRAYLSMSGDIQLGMPGPWGASTPGAFEAIVGTEDQYGEQPKSTQAFDTANMSKVLLTVRGGDHLTMYVGSSSLSNALRQETLRFLTTALGPGTPTSGQLGSVAQPTGDPSIEITSGS